MYKRQEIFLVRNHFEEAGETSVPKKSRRKRKEVTPETVEETVQEQIEGETDVHHSEQEIDPESAVDIDQAAQGIITETLSELAKEVSQKRMENRKKQKKNKGKSIAQETYLTPTNSSEEDTQPLAQRMAKLHETSLSKKVEKQKQKVQK